MKKHNVLLRKTLHYSTLVTIEASTEDEAIEKAENNLVNMDTTDLQLDDVVNEAEIDS